MMILTETTKDKMVLTAKKQLQNPELLKGTYYSAYNEAMPDDVVDMCLTLNELIVRAYESGYKEGAASAKGGAA